MAGPVMGEYVLELVLEIRRGVMPVPARTLPNIQRAQLVRGNTVEMKTGFHREAAGFDADISLAA
jgi:hypothetical protein